MSASGGPGAQRGQTGGRTQREGSAAAIPPAGSGQSLLFPGLEKEATLTPTRRFGQPNENLLCKASPGPGPETFPKGPSVQLGPSGETTQCGGRPCG